MRTLRYLVVLFFLMGMAASVQAQMQPFLLLEKPGTKQRYRYYVGDAITLRPRYQKHFNEGVIVALTDTAFYLNQGVGFGFREINAVLDRSKLHAVRSWGKYTLLAIPPMFLFSGANNLFNNNRGFTIDPEVYYLSGIFAVLGGTAHLYKGRKYNLDRRWRILVIHH